MWLFGSYVGWITNFIQQRNHAAASCAFSYSRLTFLRGMPYKLRLLLQGRPDRTSNGNQYMRGFVMSMDDFMFRQHGKRGEGSIVVRPTWNFLF